MRFRFSLLALFVIISVLGLAFARFRHSAYDRFLNSAIPESEWNQLVFVDGAEFANDPPFRSHFWDGYCAGMQPFIADYPMPYRAYQYYRPNAAFRVGWDAARQRDCSGLTSEQRVALSRRFGVPLKLEQIAIPERDHGYSNFETQMLYDAAALSDFLETKSHVADLQNFDEFANALRASFIEDQSVLLIRYIRNSDSIVEFEVRHLGTDLICEPIVKTQGVLRDIIYCCVALSVPNDLVNQIRLRPQSDGQGELVIATRATEQ